jgi:hypothetical protein
MAQLLPAASEEAQVAVSEKSPVIVTLFTATAAALALVTVTSWLALAAPTATTPKFKALEESVTGALPVPVRLTFWGLFTALSVKVSVPVAELVAVGENVTPTMQLAPAARLAAQVLLAIAKAPLIPMLEKVRDTLWRLVRVTVMAALVLPTATAPKFKVLAERVTGELVLLPVPVRFTLWGLFGALSVNVSVPVAAPVAVGVKVTPTAQLAPAAMLVPQVLLAIAKAPLIPTLEKVRGTFCWFVSVTVLAELVLPTATVLKLNVLADRVTGALPVPLRLTVWGLFSAWSVNVNAPVAAPVVTGVNVTPTMQLAPAARLAAQVLLAIAKAPLVPMLEKLKAALPRFVSVTVLAALVLPTANVPKFKLLEETVACAMPFPVRLTVCVPGSSTIVSVPEAAPTVAGANETEMVQDEPAAMLAVQVFVWIKGALAVTLATCMGPVPVFDTVTVLAALVLPWTWEEKARLAGVTVATGAVPTPARATVCTAPKLPESSLTVSTPVTGPVTDGAKVTPTVQFDPAATVLFGQLVVEGSSENPPVAEMVPRSSGLPPKFAIVIVCGGLLVPTFCEILKPRGVKLIAEGRGLGNDRGTTP